MNESKFVKAFCVRTKQFFALEVKKSDRNGELSI